MKIIYKQGDVTKATESVIVHGCNAKGVMGSGVAKAIRAAFPQACDAYRARYLQGGLDLGGIVWAYLEDDDMAIGNLITQAPYGNDGTQYVDYAAIETAFLHLDSAMSRPVFAQYGAAVAMPRIGAGLGGGDWEVIAEIIERTSEHYQPVVYDL